MNSLSVIENINILTVNVEKLIQQRNEIDKEILRIEGSLRVFKNLKDIGIETIQIKKEQDIVVDNTEVIDNDTVPIGNQSN